MNTLLSNALILRMPAAPPGAANIAGSGTGLMGSNEAIITGRFCPGEVAVAEQVHIEIRPGDGVHARGHSECFPTK